MDDGAGAGENQHLLPGISVSGFQISADSKEILYSVDQPGTNSEIWLAAVDGRSPPRRLSGAEPFSRVLGRQVTFTSWRRAKVNFLYRMKSDGTGRQKISDHPILALSSISPDAKWACVWGALANGESTSGFLLYPIGGGSALKLCNRCAALWSADPKYLYVSQRLMLEDNGRSFAIRFDHGPARDGDFPADPSSLPGVLTIHHSTVARGPDPSTYAFIKLTAHRNLYRVPVP